MSRRTATVAILAAATWSGLLLAGGLLAPAYDSVTTSSNGVTTAGTETFVAVNGLGGLAVLIVPLTVTILVGWLVLRTARPRLLPVAWALTVLLVVLSVLALPSIGVFVLPVAAALVLACGRRDDRPTAGAGHHQDP